MLIAQKKNQAHSAAGFQQEIVTISICMYELGVHMQKQRGSMSQITDFINMEAKYMTVF